MELAESSQGSMGNPMETGTKTQTDLSSQSSNPHCRARHQSPNDTHPTYNDSNCLQESLGGHELLWNKSLKTPGEGAMKTQRGSAICLHENVPWLKVAWHIQGTYKKPLFFFPTRKVFWNVSILLSRKGKSMTWGFCSSLLCAARILLWVETWPQNSIPPTPGIHSASSSVLVGPITEERNKSLLICMSPRSKFFSQDKCSINNESLKPWRKIMNLNSEKIIRLHFISLLKLLLTI